MVKRPGNWAVAIEKPGLPNLHKIRDGLYRGAQPTARGMRELDKMGIKTVVNLRAFHSDRDEIGDTPLDYEHIYVRTWLPRTRQVARFLSIATDKRRQPVFFHCQHGADRTGTMCAAYRIVVQGWTREEAIREMTRGGFGFHAVWHNLIEYVRKLDVAQVRREAGLTGHVE